MQEALLDDEQPDTILVETTGLAEPAAFPALFAAPVLATRIRLGNVVCVVDASTYLRYADHLLALPRQGEQANTVHEVYPPLCSLLTVASVGRAPAQAAGDSDDVVVALVITEMLSPHQAYAPYLRGFGQRWVASIQRVVRDVERRPAHERRWCHARRRSPWTWANVNLSRWEYGWSIL